MQFTANAHDGVASGAINVTFRFWKRPHVKVGGQYNVGAARIEVDSIDLIPFSAVTQKLARRAGCADREALRTLIAHAGPVHDDTIVYRIDFHVMGERRTPDGTASPAAVEDAIVRLDRLDRAATRGPWTRRVLSLIEEQPGVVSGELALAVDRPRPEFKVDVRKLKAIGLTESLEVGYRLTPLGHAVLEAPQ